MISKWFHLKDKARELRRKGISINKIEKRLKIPRSTLSGWFKDIALSEEQTLVLKQNWRDGLVLARKKAVVWHNKEKESRIKIVEREADTVLSEIDFSSKHLMEMTLAMLYLGEGFKKNSDTGIGNSDPLILKFFITILLKIYGVDRNKITCYLHLRADQDPTKMKKYWAQQLSLPLSAFKKVSLDQRTKGKPTYSHYKGVCIVRCGYIAVQRKLVYLSRKYCEKVTQNWAVSSFS